MKSFTQFVSELTPKEVVFVFERFNPPTVAHEKLLEKVAEIALKAHKVIGCMGVTRSDFKFYNNKFYLLEINTQPGMTKLSLVPEIAAYKGISFIQLLKWILNNASKKK